ncbi:MAG: glycine cleavage system protein GcvH [Candidatus Omnitrophica bacterium]|nr:glycine cleavage system protein GcvH [Candidatus Omnitrophota bacterium]
MEIIERFLYTKEHEWVNIEDNIGTVGITEYAQSALGDITYVELPGVDKEVEQFEQLLSVESVKSASDIFSPISGRVIEVNEDLADDPSILNRYCYDKGWIVKIEMVDEDETSNLLTADEYRNYLASLDRNDTGDSVED